MLSRSKTLLCSACLGLIATPAAADSFLSGNWYIRAGAAGIFAPTFEGSRSRKFSISPIISVGRQGREARFSSRNDSPSIGILETEIFRAGISGKLLWKRDSSTSSDLRGLSPVKFGGELGGFAELYPMDWIRLRGELRHGIVSHDGVVGDIQADAFADLAPGLRLSAGPRATYATKGYYNAYYGVDATESAASGLSRYAPGSGWKSVGVGTALTWSVTDNLSASAFAEYSRLTGPAADSSLVRERGNRNQLMFGVSAAYKFNFGL